LVRESGRRIGNNLLKPLSEMGDSFRPEDHISPSYLRLAEDFPIPICSGRTPEEDQFMNNNYCSIMTGSENFKFKHKYEYEENLFKNEDAIYTLDH
jgi:paired amphipathic helix protein Sin3a